MVEISILAQGKMAGVRNFKKKQIFLAEDCAGLGGLHESCKLLVCISLIFVTWNSSQHKKHSTTKAGWYQIKGLLCERK